MAKWGFLTNHALVLLHLAQRQDSTIREIAKAIGLTERAVITIIRALEEEDIVSHHRDGRNNVYQVDLHAVMKHMSEQTEPFTLEEIAAQTAALAKALREQQES